MNFVRLAAMFMLFIILFTMEAAESCTESNNYNKGNSTKKKKPGIVYLSTLPPYMNVTKIKLIFNRYGDVGRVFLQPAEGEKNKKKPAIHFTEGWIEFESKKVAKQVASLLNNTQIGGKKRSKFYDYLWNIKYLPRFKWAHLGERLAYERTVRRQRLRAEIAQAKREANFFASSIDKKKKKGKEVAVSGDLSQKQKVPVDEPEPEEDRTEFLKSLFA